jgi:hypothetical protein
MAYIYPSPGVDGVETTLKIAIASNSSDTGYFLPALQDITVNAANDVFSWTQLDNTAKLQIATTSTNSISMNIVLDQDAFFGLSSATAGTAAKAGVFGLSTDKTLIEFDLYLGDTSAGGTGKTISGVGYITGLAPTVSADSPVWVTPITITVTGEYTVA